MGLSESRVSDVAHWGTLNRIDDPQSKRVVAAWMKEYAPHDPRPAFRACDRTKAYRSTRYYLQKVELLVAHSPDGRVTFRNFDKARAWATDPQNQGDGVEGAVELPVALRELRLMEIRAGLLTEFSDAQRYKQITASVPDDEVFNEVYAWPIGCPQRAQGMYELAHFCTEVGDWNLASLPLKALAEGGINVSVEQAEIAFSLGDLERAATILLEGLGDANVDPATRAWGHRLRGVCRILLAHDFSGARSDCAVAKQLCPHRGLLQSDRPLHILLDDLAPEPGDHHKRKRKRLGRHKRLKHTRRAEAIAEEAMYALVAVKLDHSCADLMRAFEAIEADTPDAQFFWRTCRADGVYQLKDWSQYLQLAQALEDVQSSERVARDQISMEQMARAYYYTGKYDACARRVAMMLSLVEEGAAGERPDEPADRAVGDKCAPLQLDTPKYCGRVFAHVSDSRWEVLPGNIAFLQGQFSACLAVYDAYPHSRIENGSELSTQDVVAFLTLDKTLFPDVEARAFPQQTQNCGGNDATTPIAVATNSTATEEQAVSAAPLPVMQEDEAPVAATEEIAGGGSGHVSNDTDSVAHTAAHSESRHALHGTTTTAATNDVGEDGLLSTTTLDVDMARASFLRGESFRADHQSDTVDGSVASSRNCDDDDASDHDSGRDGDHDYHAGSAKHGTASGELGEVAKDVNTADQSADKKLDPAAVEGSAQEKLDRGRAAVSAMLNAMPKHAPTVVERDTVMETLLAQSFAAADERMQVVLDALPNMHSAAPCTRLLAHLLRGRVLCTLFNEGHDASSLRMLDLAGYIPPPDTSAPTNQHTGLEARPMCKTGTHDWGTAADNAADHPPLGGQDSSAERESALSAAHECFLRAEELLLQTPKQAASGTHSDAPRATQARLDPHLWRGLIMSLGKVEEQLHKEGALDRYLYVLEAFPRDLTVNRAVEIFHKRHKNWAAADTALMTTKTALLNGVSGEQVNTDVRDGWIHLRLSEARRALGQYSSVLGLCRCVLLQPPNVNVEASVPAAVYVGDQAQTRADVNQAMGLLIEILQESATTSTRDAQQAILVGATRQASNTSSEGEGDVNSSSNNNSSRLRKLCALRLLLEVLLECQQPGFATQLLATLDLKEDEIPLEHDATVSGTASGAVLTLTVKLVRAHRHFLMQQWRQAQELYEDVSRSFGRKVYALCELSSGAVPDDTHLQHMLANAMCATGNFERAEEIMQDVVARSDSDAAAHFCLAEVLFARIRTEYVAQRTRVNEMCAAYDRAEQLCACFVRSPQKRVSTYTQLRRMEFDLAQETLRDESRYSGESVPFEDKMKHLDEAQSHLNLCLDYAERLHDVVNMSRPEDSIAAGAPPFVPPDQFTEMEWDARLKLLDVRIRVARAVAFFHHSHHGRVDTEVAPRLDQTTAGLTSAQALAKDVQHEVEGAAHHVKQAAVSAVADSENTVPAAVATPKQRAAQESRFVAMLEQATKLLEQIDVLLNSTAQRKLHLETQVRLLEGVRNQVVSARAHCAEVEQQDRNAAARSAPEAERIALKQQLAAAREQVAEMERQQLMLEHVSDHLGHNAQIVAALLDTFHAIQRTPEAAETEVFDWWWLTPQL